MRKIIALAVLVCILAIPAAAEMRGLWVDAFHPGVKSPKETADMVSAAKACNITDLFVQVRKRGDVCYNSSIEPMAADVAPGYDPLADVVARAHSVGMKVHAWITVYEVYHDTKWNKAHPRQVHVRHPEWLMKDHRGSTRLPDDEVFLDPGLPEVQAYLADIVEEIARSYDVDGIHLDVVKYPSPDTGYNDASLARFAKHSGKSGKPDGKDEAWTDWRCDQITEFVKLSNQRLKKVNKKAALSAAVYANRFDARLNKMQDWVKWSNTGLVDFVVPMIFAINDGVFEQMCKDALLASRKAPVYIGQGGFKTSPESAVRQVETAVRLGAPGTVIYSYWTCCRPRGNGSISVLDALRAGPFAGK